MSRYSDADRAAALAALDANGGNLAGTARQLGMPRKTLAEWAAGRTPPGMADLRQQKRGDLATELEGIAYKLVEAMPGKIEGANLQQLATSLGIAVDKVQLLKGKPTSITADTTLTPQERADRVVHLLDTARQRRQAEAG